MRKLTIYTDGASRGNPGLAACAWIILDGLEVLEAESAGAGENTNNFAEYTALISALRSAKKYCTPNETELDVYSDSELMIRQLTGQYAVRSPALKPLFSEAVRLSKDYASVSYTHVPRENPYISSCDWMCNQALDMLKKREEERRSVPKPVCMPVGIVHSPYKEAGSAPKQGRITNDISEIEIYPEFEDALDGLFAGDDIFVLCWFDRSDR
ncbi:MAG TPA: ribonuclease HI family protein, partial [Methanocorpusculum sp.]|nr:ribonuclease HI family protein [Methanocorpusculum sp.]